MLNQVILVGRLKEWRDDITMVITIPKNDKECDADVIDIIVKGQINESAKEYCNKGDIVGIKGRLETGNKIIGEKITFLTSHKQENDEE